MTAMGTDATVAFQDSLPESGQWDCISWKRSVVNDWSVPIGDGGGDRERTFAANSGKSKADIRYATPINSVLSVGDCMTSEDGSLEK
jgi:hypothetical protein